MAEMRSLSSSHYTVKVRKANSNHTVSPKRLKVYVSKNNGICKYIIVKKNLCDEVLFIYSQNVSKFDLSSFI